MGVKSEKTIKQFTEKYSKVCVENNAINPDLFEEYGVKRGLRDKNGKGVLAGLTNISFIKSSEEIDGKSVPCEGQLYYRGYNIYDLVRGFQTDGRYGFDECAYLLLFGKLPDAQQLIEFKKITDMSLENVLRQCLMLISVFPMLSVYGYHAYNHYECDESLYIHRPDRSLSAAENILRMLRPDMAYTPLEASVLDAALVLHMEHGGGNNSTFTTRVVTSAGSDTYSVIAAALSSLKGPKHGGANIKVVQMMEDLRRNVGDVTDEDEVKGYLYRLLNKEAFDRSGLIYGMGHAVYSISDPRAVIFKGFVEKLANEKKRHKDFELYSMIERLAPEVISEKCRIYKGVSANVDFYSGFVYSMLDIPLELYTPIFAIARIVGWSAHRIEELINVDKIIRPAYKSIGDFKPYETLKDRSTPKIDGQENKIIGIEML
jgi:citrate synthase